MGVDDNEESISFGSIFLMRKITVTKEQGNIDLPHRLRRIGHIIIKSVIPVFINIAFSCSLRDSIIPCNFKCMFHGNGTIIRNSV